MNLYNYTCRLVKDGQRWQHESISDGININETPKKTHYFLNIQWFFIFVALLIVVICHNCINSNFAGYIITALSIFIGLYISLIILVFDKFGSTNFDTTAKPRAYKISLVKKKNFFLQFTALTSYSIIIAIACILLVSFSFLPEFNIKIDVIQGMTQFIYHITDYESFSLSNLILIGILSIRFLTIYFLLDFIFILLYAITSMYSYISKEYNDKEININT